MGNASNRLVRESIRGPHALDMRYMKFVMPVFFPLSILVQGVHGLSLHELQIVILSRALGWIALFAYFISLSHWWRRGHAPKLTFALLVLLSGTGGGIEFAVAILSARLFGLNPEISIFHYMAVGFFSKTMWLPINAFLVSSILSFREQREELLQRVNTLSRISFRQNGLAQKVRDIVEDEVMRDLHWSRATVHAKFQSSIESKDGVALDPQFLKKYANEELRTISHELWAQSAKKTMPPSTTGKRSIKSMWELFQLGIHLPPFDVRIYCLIYASGVIPLLSKDSNSSVGFLVAPFLIISFYLLMVLGEKLYERFSHLSPIIYTIRLAVAVYLPFYLFSLLFRGADFWSVPHPISFQVSIFLLVTLVAILTTLSKATIYSHQQIIQVLSRTSKSKKVQVNLAAIEIAAVSREWAKYIHGNLQSRLLAAAAILEGSVDGINVPLKEAAVIEATRIMSGDFEAPDSSNRSLLDEINFQVAHWRDLIEIEIDYTLEKDPAWVSANDFGTVVEQTVANAFRHGQATKIVISIHLNNDGWVECNFTDNGNGMATGDRHPGLGSSIFGSLAWGNWSLKPGPGGIGTCLHMIIPALELPPARGGSSVG